MYLLMEIIEDMGFFIVSAAIIMLVVNAFVANVFKSIAEMKGWDGKPYFWWTFFLGPVGMMMVIALPDRGNRNVIQSIASATSTTNIEDELPDL